MTFLHAYRDAYRGSIAFLVACPLLALIPVAFELLQHVAEVRIGMYDSIAAAKATEHHPVRMAFGMAKVLSLILPGYWVTRFLAFGDRRRAAAADKPAVLLFAGVIGFHLVVAAVQLFVLPRSIGVTLAAFAVGQVIGCLLPAWSVAAALGNPRIGPLTSSRIMARQLPWTFAFLLLTILPLMVPHYALGAAALLVGRAWLWPVLVADALLVGLLSAVMIAGSYVAALRAARRHGRDLRPAGAAAVSPPPSSAYGI
ncbi:hypothetical protein [Sphingomonas sp. CLY1604]|uniref:hypothetical protein n=1 Tax=Sphingomonas sp. CLY1604 TaxID=3457786 RepID=UPI003FD75A64